MADLLYMGVPEALPLDDETYMVVCSRPSCRQWAVAYTTLEENPRPWLLDDSGKYIFPHEIMPDWYVCQEHLTSKHRLLDLHMAPPACERCGETKGVEWVGGMTSYDESRMNTAWDYITYGPAGRPSGNRSCPYCPDCAKDYREFWGEQWKDYYSSR